MKQICLIIALLFFAEATAFQPCAGCTHHSTGPCKSVFGVCYGTQVLFGETICPAGTTACGSEDSKYSCTNGECVVNTSGEFVGLTACQASCSTNYKCTGGNCEHDSEGPYSSLEACSAGCTDSPKTKPNIIFIMSDDLGYGEHNWCNDYANNLETPTLDTLAAQSIILDNYYV